jgi:FAD-dependent urate hydroxylase
MPAGMLLESPWSASSLADPDRRLTLDRFVAEAGAARVEPIPLPYFLEYCRWFREQAVPRVDAGRVCSVRQAGGGFRVRLADGRSLDAGRVVVATGMARFPHVPDFARGLPAHLVWHTADHGRLARLSEAELAGADVAVVGAGQSALEAAALLAEGGARVEVIARGPFAWVDGHRHQAHPLLLRRLPARLRRAMARRSVRPAGARWLRPRVVDAVHLTPGTGVREVSVAGHGVRLALSDGSARYVDRIVLGTGYRVDVRRIDFLGPDLLLRLRTAGPLPRLDRWFQSSVPGLHFVGALAEHDFGPVCRFVAGAAVAARQVAARAAAGHTP